MAGLEHDCRLSPADGRYGVSGKITDRILDTLEKLEEFPLMGPLHSDEFLARMEYRKVVCGDYVCVYKLIDETVFIYRIVHGATDYPKQFK